MSKRGSRMSKGEELNLDQLRSILPTQAEREANQIEQTVSPQEGTEDTVHSESLTADASDVIIEPGSVTPEKKELPQVLPNNSKLYLLADFEWEYSKESQGNYPDVNDYAQAYWLIYSNPADPNYESIKAQVEQVLGVQSPEDAARALTPEEVSVFLDKKIQAAAVSDIRLRNNYLRYKKYLISQGIALDNRPPEVQQKAERGLKPEIEGKPSFQYKNGILIAKISLKNVSGSKVRTFDVAIPQAAQNDLETQKKFLELTVEDIITRNDFRLAPRVGIGAESVVLSYGSGANEVVGLEIPVARVEEALKQAKKNDRRFALSLEAYNQAVQFKQSHPHPEDLDNIKRAQSAKADTVIVEFERFLFSLPATGSNDRRRAGTVARNQAFRILWSRKVGADAVRKLETQAGITRTTLPEVGNPQTEDVKPRLNAWTRPLDFTDAMFKNKVDRLLEKLEKQHDNDLASLLASFSNKGKRDPLRKYAEDIQLPIEAVVRIVVSKVLSEKGYADIQAKFDQISSLQTSEIQQQLRTEFKPSGSSKGDALRAFVVQELEGKSGKQKEEVSRVEEKIKPPKFQAKNTGVENNSSVSESEGSREEDGEEENEEPELENDDVKTSWERVELLLNEHPQLTIELLENEFGVSGIELDEVLSGVLEEMGFLDAYDKGLKEYELQSTTESLVDAINEYSAVLVQLGERKKQVDEETPESHGSGLHKEDEVSEESVKTDHGVEIPENFEFVKTVNKKQEVVLQDRHTKTHFIAIVHDGKVAGRAALPEGFKVDDAKELAIAGHALETILREQGGSLNPKLGVEGDMFDASKPLTVKVSLGGELLAIKLAEAVNRNTLAEAEKSKDEHNEIFKALLIQRLKKYSAIPLDKLAEEDKQQLKITEETLLRLLKAPQVKGLSFVERLLGQVLSKKIESLKHPQPAEHSKPKAETKEKEAGAHQKESHHDKHDHAKGSADHKHSH